MSEWDDLGLDEEIIAEFVGEAISGLDALRPTLLHLEEAGHDGIDGIFRWVHTVKGTSGFLNLSAMQSFAHKFETYLQKLKSGKLELTHNLIAKAIEGVELLNDALLNLQQKQIQLSDEYEAFVRDLPQDAALSEQRDSIDKVLERLNTILTALDERKETFADKGIPAVVLNAVSDIEVYLKKLEDFKVQVVVKSLTLESVVGPDGKDLTACVQTVLEGMEDAMLVGTAAKSLTSDDVNQSAESIHKSLYPDIEKVVFQWGRLAELVDLMPEIVEDFWKKFWFDSLEKHATIIYADGDGLTRRFKEQLKISSGDEGAVTSGGEGAVTSGEVKGAHHSDQEQTIRVDTAYLERFTRRTEALVMNRNYMENLGMELRKHLPTHVSMEFREGIDDLEQNIEDLQKNLFLVRSTRLRELYERMPRMVRKLEKDLAKSVRVETKGEKIEVDRSVVNILSDIFVHVIRNSIDHGIESPQERLEAGKPETGVIKISAIKDDDWIYIDVIDDGRGIDRARVLEKALEKGLAKPDQDYADEEILNFLLEPGFSTAQQVTNVSGRGVGMDVVASSIHSQGGRVSISSELNQGTTIQMSLPTRKGSLTRDVLLVEIDQRIYGIAHDCLREIIDANGVISTREKGRNFFCHRDQLMHIADLSTILHYKHHNDDRSNSGRLLILEDEKGDTVAARVDRVLNKMQVVIKGFTHDFLKKNDLFEGTVVIGLGQPILVLNLKDTAALSCF